MCKDNQIEVGDFVHLGYSERSYGFGRHIYGTVKSVSGDTIKLRDAVTDGDFHLSVITVPYNKCSIIRKNKHGM